MKNKQIKCDTMEENRIIVMTPAELRTFAENVVKKAMGSNDVTNAQTENPKKYVYGLRGICELFKVSHTTAQKYKDTFLAQAVSQRGRKIMIDRDLAIQLYNNSMK